MGIRSHIRRNLDIKLHEPIATSEEATKQVKDRARRSKKINAGFMAAGLGLGLLSGVTGLHHAPQTDKPGGLDTTSPIEDTLQKVAGGATLILFGSALAERKLIRSSLKRTVRNYRQGLGLPQPGRYELSIVTNKDGQDTLNVRPATSGVTLPDTDFMNVLPSVGSWATGLTADYVAGEYFTSLSSRVAMGAFSTFCAAGSAVVYNRMNTAVDTLEADALHKIQALDLRIKPE